MNDMPLTYAEQKAEEATRLPAFQINFQKLRSGISSILSDWKSSGIFYEYTDHSFTHARDMLAALDWILPPDSQLAMSPADWFMLVLSIYFHDIGLVVTKNEYEARKQNGDFAKFIANPILTSDKQREYNARLGQMTSDERDRLNYQEFVRYTHGRRVKAWLEGEFLFEGDATGQQRSVISELISSLDRTVRRDLALLCESHTVGDIDDTSIYSVSQPYGGENETVNLQYCAIILRTVDLIQITHQRAPGVLYQLISPSNPKSQSEWLRHNAVRAVRPAAARDREGAVSLSAQSDTIEVFATFQEPDGYFGLTNYLTYAEKEIAACYSAIKKSQKHVGKNYLYPWRSIDQSNIRAEGFLQEQFEFELDQHKILDLLTGHTLYNDTTVVLRELTQNALDAVRLQCEIEHKSSNEYGRVDIHWNSSSKSLTITDNGTGMTQEVVVNHLLKVGSSRYQDPKFRDKHPDFHSISRFGIGVLSAFMVSDDVEITTCSEEEETARTITLRSVHGKYLIKLLNKITDKKHLPMHPHGTSVKIVLRATAEVSDVLQVAKTWLVFPRCKVFVHVDEAAPIQIGYASPREAMERYLESGNFIRSKFKTEYKVVEYTKNDVTVAFAINQDKLFKDWGFVEASRGARPYGEDEVVDPVATCVEGVAVENSTPGFRSKTFLAIANAIGKTAPKTNVARSALEDTSEYRDMIKNVYDMYAKHISEEIVRLKETPGHSLSRAVAVGPFIASPLVSNNELAAKPALLSASVAEVPLILVEEKNERNAISLAELGKKEEFWTVNSPLYKSVEFIVKEATSDITATKILDTLGNSVSGRSAGLTVCNLGTSSHIDDSVRHVFDVAEIIASESLRQVELRWIKRTSTPLWLTSTTIYNELSQRDAKFFNLLMEMRDRGRSRSVGGDRTHVPGPGVTTHGLDSASAVIVSRERYLRPNTALADFLYSLKPNGSDDSYKIIAVHLLALESLNNVGVSWSDVSQEILQRVLGNIGFEVFNIYFNKSNELIEAMRATGSNVFDPFAWNRRTIGPNPYDYY